MGRPGRPHSSDVEKRKLAMPENKPHFCFQVTDLATGRVFEIVARCAQDAYEAFLFAVRKLDPPVVALCDEQTKLEPDEESIGVGSWPDWLDDNTVRVVSLRKVA